MKTKQWARRSSVVVAAAALVGGSISLPRALADPVEGEPGPEECGTRFTPEEGAIARTLHEAGVYNSAGRMSPTDVYTVRLKAHIVRRTNGTGGLPMAQLTTGMDDLAAAFLASNIRFVLEPIDYIDDDAAYNATTWAEYDAYAAQVSGDKVEVYFFPQITTESGSFCGVSAFSFSSIQGILMANGCMGLATNPSTFPHEIGHYFDLFHTHEPFYGDECPTGENCATTGDLVCDTPADPRLSSSTVSSCVYTGGEFSVAPCAVAPYAPDVTNLMSYAPKTCRDNFSPGQSARARATLENLRPEHIAMTHSLSLADFNSDLIVNGADLAILLAAWGSTGPFDLNGDTLVGGADLAILLAAWTPELP